MLKTVEGVELDVGTLIDRGVLGIVVLLFLLGWIWAKPAVEQQLKDKEKIEAQRDALLKMIEEQVIPVLGDLSTKVVPVINEIRDDVKVLKSKASG